MRKVELEFRLNELQETRKDLMSELEELMKVLKVQGSTSNQAAKFSKISRNANLRLVQCKTFQISNMCSKVVYS